MLIALALFLQWSNIYFTVESKCTEGCPLALASYYVWDTANLTMISSLLNASTNDALIYNPSVPDLIRLQSFIRVNIPFSCNCINQEFLGHVFKYQLQKGDTYDKIATVDYANLTTSSLIEEFNGFDPNDLPDNGIVNVPVNCSCGNKKISKKYGLFLSYPLRVEDNLKSLAKEMNSTPSELQRYNPNVNFDGGSGLVFIPAKDKTGEYPPVTSSQSRIRMSIGTIAGISVAVIAVLTVFAAVRVAILRRKKRRKILVLGKPEKPLTETALGSSSRFGIFLTHAEGSAGKVGVTVEKSVEFSYEELAEATNNFSISNKIGTGGFGAVYFAELRGKKCAVKKMDMQASKEFLAEINVLTHVHHSNLVCLIGYSVKKALSLVYEYVENGNLSQHLHSSGRDPLPWSARVQIALDSARGLEYIHEHTVPVYIHRDIKSANILIDNSYHAKVADFGLAKLIEVGSVSTPSGLMGTFGYMPPEYAHYGSVSPKIDVYAYGVVLYQLISAKEAVVKENISDSEFMSLAALFNSQPIQMRSKNLWILD